MNEIASLSTSTPPAAPAPSKRQLLDTPINRAFLFLYHGAVRDKIKIPPILDTSDDEAENYPMISGVEYMRNAMDAQIKHEQAPDPSRAALVAALRGLLGLVEKRLPATTQRVNGGHYPTSNPITAARQALALADGKETK